jgi:hypothetical protein
MTTIGRYKRISELPESRPEDVEVLGLNAAGTNVRVHYDVRQAVGASETSVMSQAAITAELKKRDAAIEQIVANSIGVITSPDESISVGNNSNGVTIGVNATKVIAEKSGLKAQGNRIGVAIDPSKGNRLTLTPSGELRVESENYWNELK